MARGTEPGQPAGILAAWPRWEHFARYMWPTMTIPGAPFGLLEIRIEPYDDKPLVLGDGTEIREGMLIGEMHCNNLALLDLIRKKQVNPFRACREDLHSLAAWVSSSETGAQVEAFFALTMLSRGAARLGFSVRHRPVNFRNRLDRLFMTGLLLLYNVDGLERLTRGATLRSYPQEVWMSRRKLLHLYRKPGALASKSDSEILAD
ncbi:MAG: YkoP family protein [Candidatus Binataceae bacterium]